MKKSTIAIAIYAVLVFSGGLMGYMKANSLISLGISSVLAALLFVCSYFISKGNRFAFDATLGIQAAILIFFTIRFFQSFAFMPAGMMSLLTLCSLGFLLSQRKSFYPS